MSNPVRLFENLRDMYVRYLDSPFDLRYEDLVEERRQLLDRDGRIYRNPLIEPIPAYRSTGQSFAQAASLLLANTWRHHTINDAIDFVSRGLFPATYTLHQHRRDVIEETLVNGRDADLLDVQEERELKVGLRVVRDASADIIGQIFLSDTLENGAGYASVLGRPDFTEALRRYIVGQSDPTFHSFLVSSAHAGPGANACDLVPRLPTGL